MEYHNTMCVVLCGGQGTRMGSSEKHKVCFPLAGVPAIVRTLSMLKSVGLERFLIVVGQMADQVMATITAEHPGIAFIYQPAARGTGHAAACAAQFLQSAGFEGEVIVTMGDKVIHPSIVTDLVSRHRQTSADMTLMALPKTAATTAGRILQDGRRKAIAIVEVKDLKQAAEKGTPIRIGRRKLLAEQIEKQSPSVNASLYLFEAAALYRALGKLQASNAQDELYLTDTLANLVAEKARICVVDVANPEDLLAFNTPEELLFTEEVFGRWLARRRRISVKAPMGPAPSVRPVGEWIRIFEANSSSLRQTLTQIYGSDLELLEERRSAFLRVLEEFTRRYGLERRVVLTRAPGRINLMGRHIDHRGGYVNVMAISREIVMAAAARDDDVVSLANLHSDEFPERQFNIGSLLQTANWCDWMDFIHSVTVQQVLLDARGDWSNYAKAAVLRLQHACPDHRLAGMDCVVSGNIPVGAGLSSSSAIVVAVAEASVALNGLQITMQQFVDLCGEGEWFVGSRGGSADHAAIRSGERGQVVRVGFFPFRIEETIPFPNGLSLVVANSKVRVSKSADARDTFNHRVACYDLLELLLKKNTAALKGLEHFRDLSPARLGISTGELYRILKQLPRRASRGYLRRLLPGLKDRIENIFSTHHDLGHYGLRDVAIYGIAECQRSEMFADLLRQRRLEMIGELMRLSHDGDRLVRHRNGETAVHVASYSNQELDRLILSSISEDPARRQTADFWGQSGRYACSTPEIDYIVDLATSLPDVVGAQLAGAGLGGCAMIFAGNMAVQPLIETLRNDYYEPRELSADVHVFRPVAGSGVFSTV